MKIIPVRSWKQAQQFCQFQFSSPGRSPNSVFNTAFNPVMQHLDYECFLAQENQQIIGRIAAIKDQLNPRPQEGFFGNLEVLNNPLAAQKLLEAAAHSLKKRGCQTMLGPATWNSNQQVGVLVEGDFNSRQPGLPFNPPYYPQLIEQAGLQKLTDLLSFHWFRESGFPALTAKIARRVKRNPEIKLQKINFARLKTEALGVQKIYAACFEENWGFIPLTSEESLALLRFLGRFGDPDLQLKILVGSQLAGILLCTPSSAPSRAKATRIAILGVAPEFRLRGLEALLLERLFQVMEQKKYQEADISQIHEENQPMLSVLAKLLPLQPDRRFRVYQKALDYI